MEVARSEHPAVVLDGEIMVIGGLIERRMGGAAATSSVEAFDGRWRSLPDLPEPRHHAAAAVVDGRLFVLGGFDGSGFNAVSTVWELSGPAWVDRAALPSPVGSAAAAVIDGHIYLVGGVPEGALFVYDPAEDEWQRLADPSERREHLAAVSFEGELWALGGRWSGDAVSSTEVFDPSTGLWRTGPAMNEPRSGFGASVFDGSIVVAGGEVFEPLEALESVERLIGGEWMLENPLPLGLHGNPLVGLDGVLYLPGGSDQPGGVANRGALFMLED
jgi:hypothetical protein